MNPVRLSTLLPWSTHLVCVSAVKLVRVKAVRSHQRRRISSAYGRSPTSDLERLRMQVLPARKAERTSLAGMRSESFQAVRLTGCAVLSA
jgi:hypothetical protein